MKKYPDIYAQKFGKTTMPLGPDLNPGDMDTKRNDTHSVFLNG